MDGKKKKKQKVNFRYNLQVYFGFIKKYKPLFIATLFVSLILEGIVLIPRFLFKELIDKGTEFVSGTLLRWVFIQNLVLIAGIFIAVSLFRSFLDFIYLHLINTLEVKLIKDLKTKFFNHILSLSHNFHVTHKTGSLISRLSRGGGAMERLTDVIVFSFTPLIFQLIVASASIIYFDFVPAIVILITVLVFLGYSFIFQNFQQESNVKANRTEDIEKGTMADFITNIDAIKYFGKEMTIKSRFEKLAEKTKKAFLKNWNYVRGLSAGQSLILNAGTFFLIYFPIISFLNGDITLGTVAFIYSVYTGLIGDLFGFVHGIRNFYRSMADFEELFQYGKIENEVKDKPNAEKLKIKKGEIELKNVCFKYGKRNIFDGLDLKIPKNKKVALVGHSGCGKTTLVKLLFRFYDIQYGQILIDGKDIRNFKQESLREEMPVVPQEVVLFDDSVYNNIAFSNPKASKKQVMRAIKFAQLDRVIKEFPYKERTIVGEKGVKLSGGEKQRVSIARAILANKKVLVLDEATSSLDSETEKEIQEALEKLMKGRTTIIIAHRLSTIMKADKIVVMKKGEIIQEGTHEELIKQKGEYKKLWGLQRGGYIK